MGLSKTEKFSDRQNRIAALAKGLGHPARIAILEHLFQQNACVCGDLVQEIGLAQPTISQHLKELKNLGLIRGNVEGTKVCYCIDPENWQTMRQVLSTFLRADSHATNPCSPID